MSDLIIGNKVGAKHLSFMTDKDLKELHTAWFPKIEINGSMLFIKDDNAKIGIAEFQTRHEAIKYGKKTLREMKERFSQN